MSRGFQEQGSWKRGDRNRGYKGDPGEEEQNRRARKEQPGKEETV